MQMTRRHSCLRIGLAAGLIAVPVLTSTAPALHAQATASGSIAGTVTDPSNAAIVGAVVTATNVATNAQRSTKTGNSGDYRFDLLPAGRYSIHVEAQGFSVGEAQGIDLLVGTTSAVNVPMKPGGAGETVQVQAINQLVDPEKTDVSTAVTPRQIEDLPLNGRDFANLAILAPGVKQVDSYDPTKNRYAVYAVNGSTGRNTNTTVNGVDNKDNTVGGAVMQLPLEAVQEFIISPNRFSAANGRSEGAALNVVTKSGTNLFHGSALWLFPHADDSKRTTTLPNRAISRSRTTAGSSTAARLGGPIRRDKDFGFFAYEGLRERSSISVNPGFIRRADAGGAACKGSNPISSR